tara:strand:- start:1083 stop:2072 length:990 start_codon:yes stop_codon:yes gene_type:complete
MIKETLSFEDSDIDIILNKKKDLKKIILHFRNVYKHQIIRERKTYNQYYIIVSDGQKVHAFDFSIGLIINGIKLIDSSFFFNNSEEIIRQEYRLVKNRFKQKNEFTSTNKIYKFFFKIKKNFTNKKGKLVVFIGVDGSGKSTVIEDLLLKFSIERKLFNISNYHFRPKIIKGSFSSKVNIEKSIDSPHLSKELNIFKSHLKILFIVLNYLLFLPVLHLKKFFGHIIIFDRYYTDIFFDTKRYRLNTKSLLLGRIFQFIIPKPDKMFFILGDEKRIYERKKEVDLHEIIETHKRYNIYIEKNLKISVKILNNETKERFISETTRNFISIL